MNRINITTLAEARDYLLKVLEKWDEFTQSHKGIEQATRILLDESKHK